MTRLLPRASEVSARHAGGGLKRPPRGGGSGADRAAGPVGLPEPFGTDGTFEGATA
jgi:hypothetical protein